MFVASLYCGADKIVLVVLFKHSQGNAPCTSWSKDESPPPEVPLPVVPPVEGAGAALGCDPELAVGLVAVFDDGAGLVSE